VSKSDWAFKPTAVRRAWRTIEKMGFTPSGVQFGNNGTFTVFVGDPERRSVPPEQEQAFNAQLRKGAA
jgi:hypothetical protein